MKGQSDEQKWNALREMVPDNSESEKLKRRLMQTVRKGSFSRRRFFSCGLLLAACLLFIACGSLLFLVQQEEGLSEDAAIMLDGHPFTWELPGTEVRAAPGKVEFFRKTKGEKTLSGSAEAVTEDEMNSIISARPMYVKQELMHFPYKTIMYIEHVKMMDTALRYHFFIQPEEKEWIYFTFDYPKFEYAEIFRAVAGLRFKGAEPYIHPDPLYVRHGYGELLYPVGLTPASISSGHEEYRWDEASNSNFTDYLKALETSPEGWEKQESAGNSHHYKSGDGLMDVIIRLEGDKLTYTIHYSQE